MMTGFLLRLDSLEEYSVLDDQQFGRLIRAALQFAIDGTEPVLSSPESYLWPGMRLKILHDAEQYRRKCEQNAENARRGWNLRRSQAADANACDRIQTHAMDANNNCNGNSNSKDNIKGNDDIGASIGGGGKSPSKRFTPPTVEEVRAYCEERKNGINPEHFVDYYERSGWIMSNGQRMKNWKAAVRTWESNRKGGGNNGGYTGNQTEHGEAHRPDYSFLRNGSNSV